jgi:hypothetical protein
MIDATTLAAGRRSGKSSILLLWDEIWGFAAPDQPRPEKTHERPAIADGEGSGEPPA